MVHRNQALLMRMEIVKDNIINIIMNKELLEKLSSIQHDAWAHWTRHLLRIGKEDNEGNLILPKDRIDKWRRQVDQDYSVLSEEEKEKDREVVRYVKLIELIEDYLNKQKTK